MPSNPYKNIPDDILKETLAEEDASKGKDSTPKKGQNPKGDKNGKKNDKKNDGPEIKETKQKGLFKKRRAGVVLTKEQEKEIKEGRKKLRKEMKERGIKSKREFELVAGSLGLYFDKRRYGIIPWLLNHWLAALIGALLALLAVLFIFSTVTHMRGLYTINLSDNMFKEGFVLSDTVGFEHPTLELFAEPAENVPCVSIKNIKANVDKIDGLHSEDYFAYTYYIRNEGESIIDFTWELELTSESKDLSSGAWIGLYVDGKLGIYAKANSETGKAEVLPPLEITDRGYIDIPLMKTAPDSDQFKLITRRGDISYYRVEPYIFESDEIVTSGTIKGVKPGEVHKYTVFIWLEGDDKDADNSKIGGHLGTQMNFRLANEKKGEREGLGAFFEDLWENLKFWD